MNNPYEDHVTRLDARILIVEDDPAHAEAMRRSLEAANWTNIEVVETLQDFRNRSAEDPPSIALIDLNLPDGRATELFIHPAAEGEFPLIVMTSLSDVKTVIEVMKGGAFDYVLKSKEAFQELPHMLIHIQREWAVLRERTDFMNEVNAIYELSMDVICIAGLNGYFRRVNPAFQNILGYSHEELCSKPFIEFVHPDDRTATLAEASLLAKGNRTLRFNNRYQTKAGAYRWLEWNAALAPKGDCIYAVARDITERKKAEEKIHHLAFYDALTMLPNRRLLVDHLLHAMATGTRTMEYASLLFIDLDNFKTLNDTQGHSVGDLLLTEVARRLLECVRDVDTVSRLGGDEYVVLLECLSEDREHAASQAMQVGEKIRAVLAKPYNLDGLEHHSSASIGISLFRGEEVKLDDLLKHADTAMYQAKDAGRNALRFFDPNMQASLETRTLLEAELRYALVKRQLSLHYQMQVDAQGKVIGAEALLRWLHPEHGMVSPKQFIPIAESTGLIVPIGTWVLQTACAQINEWQTNPDAAHFQLAINVSARQFRQPDFVEKVLETIKASGIDPQLLKLELTESLVLDNIKNSITKMHALRDAGVRFSIDDFGTGQSSLSNLRRLPLDQIKIDRSFVHDIATNDDDAAIVKTIIMMANNLGMEVIAEGVETEAQREYLESNGCYLYQGFLFGKPMPIEDFNSALNRMVE